MGCVIYIRVHDTKHTFNYTHVYIHTCWNVYHYLQRRTWQRIFVRQVHRGDNKRNRRALQQGFYLFECFPAVLILVRFLHASTDACAAYPSLYHRYVSIFATHTHTSATHAHTHWTWATQVFLVLGDLTHCNTRQHTKTHCDALQHTATHCHALQLTATHCNTLQHTATHCNTLQYTATHCNT